MSQKNNIVSYDFFGGFVDATTNPSSATNPSNINWLDNCSIQIFWTGATLAGEFKVFASNDKINVAQGIIPSHWTQLDLGAPVLIDSTNLSGGIIINLNQFSLSALYVSFTLSSGTGTIQAKMTVKEVG